MDIMNTHNASVRRLVNDQSNSNLEGYEQIINDLKINIQPAGPEHELLSSEGETGKVFLGYTTRSGIQEQMLVVTSGNITTSGKIYKVVGIEDWRGGLGRHFQLVMRLENK